MIINNQGLTKGVFTDGDLKRLMQNKDKISNSKIKIHMTKNPYCVEENTLASEVLSQMNKKKLPMFVFIIIKIKIKRLVYCTYMIY